MSSMTNGCLSGKVRQVRLGMDKISKKTETDRSCTEIKAENNTEPRTPKNCVAETKLILKI